MSVSRVLACLPLLLVALLAVPASAVAEDDQPFVTLYTTDIEDRGAADFEQWLFWRAGHKGQSFNEYLSESEIEYGLTDNLQGSLYLNYDRSRERNTGGATDRDSFVGSQAELIYRALNVHEDPFGLAFYLEPSYSAEEHGIETKILLQKNFLADRLRWVVNVNFEDDWDHDQGHWSKVSALEFDSGLAYLVGSGFSAGLEFDNERAFEGLILGTPASEQSSAYYLGPTLHYDGEPFDVTLGAEAQLPWAGSHIDGLVHDGIVANAERFRVIFRMNYAL